MNIALTTTDHLFPDTTRPFGSGTTDRITTRTRQLDIAAVPAAIRSEWIKLRSLRANRAIFVLAIVAGLLMSWVLATFVKTDPYEHKPFTVANSFMVSSWLTLVLAAIAGILHFTKEVQHGTLAHALAAQPARWVVVAGKVVVLAAFGLAMGAVGMLAGFVGAAGSGMHLGDTSGIAATVAWALLLTPLCGVLGLAVGMIIRHSAAAVSAAMVWMFVIENLIRSVAPANLSRLLPFSAANGMLGIRTAGDTTATLAAALSRTQDALLFAGYSVAALALGTVLLYRRDAD
jgi:ABC-type transport system involved in multi-copper enzyme maturation permease subunit